MLLRAGHSPTFSLRSSRNMSTAVSDSAGYEAACTRLASLINSHYRPKGSDAEGTFRKLPLWLEVGSPSFLPASEYPKEQHPATMHSHHIARCLLCPQRVGLSNVFDNLSVIHVAGTKGKARQQCSSHRVRAAVSRQFRRSQSHRRGRRARSARASCAAPATGPACTRRRTSLTFGSASGSTGASLDIHACLRVVSCRLR